MFFWVYTNVKQVFNFFNIVYIIKDRQIILSSKTFDAQKIGTASQDVQKAKGHGFGLLNCKGIIEKYKKNSVDRKPDIGMLNTAAKQYDIDKLHSWMIGDSDNDISAGKAAGCKTALIGEKEEGQDVTVSCLYEFVELVLKD